MHGPAGGGGFFLTGQEAGTPYRAPGGPATTDAHTCSRMHACMGHEQTFLCRKRDSTRNVAFLPQCTLISPDHPSEACTTRPQFPSGVSCARPSRAINAPGPRDMSCKYAYHRPLLLPLHAAIGKGRENNPPVSCVTYTSLQLARPGPYVHVCHVLFSYIQKKTENYCICQRETKQKA